MTVTRRSFLRSGAVTVLLTGLALDSVPLAFAAQPSRKSDTAAGSLASSEAKEPALDFRRETFEPHLNSVFALGEGASSIKATLVNVRECRPHPRSHKVTPKSRQTESFALVFQADGKLTDVRTIHDVAHRSLGQFPLFLTRRDGPRDTYFYEAVFNRAL